MKKPGRTVASRFEVGSQTHKALRQLAPLITNESVWVKRACQELVISTAAPNMWDEEIMLENKCGVRIYKKCDAGHYSGIAEKAYKGIDIDIDKFIAESNSREVK